jgi:alkanesulfonate monooxygenase
MPVEFIGISALSISPRSTRPRPGHRPRLCRGASPSRHDEGGFDRALVAFGSTSPESQLVVAHAASVTNA